MSQLPNNNSSGSTNNNNGSGTQPISSSKQRHNKDKNNAARPGQPQHQHQQQQQQRRSRASIRAPQQQRTPAGASSRYGNKSPSGVGAGGASPFYNKRSGGASVRSNQQHRAQMLQRANNASQQTTTTNNIGYDSNAMVNTDDDMPPLGEEEDDDDEIVGNPYQRNRHGHTAHNKQQKAHQAKQKQLLQQQQGHTTLPFENTLPQDVCTQHHVPAHATFSLTSIHSLTQYIPPGSLVVFDLDDTLIKKEHNSTQLLTQNGTNHFHNYVQSAACAHMTYEEKQEMVNQLGMALKAFVPAEPDTVNTVKVLQSRGCYVFALTARSSTMSTATSVCLNELGINFQSTLPPTMPQHAIEPQTGAAVIDGIIYCNDVPKGVVFQRLLAMQWITFPVLHQCSQYTCGSIAPTTCENSQKIVACTAQQIAHHKNTPCPERTVWFVDDNLPMLSSMLQSWQQFAHQRVEFYNSLQPSIQQQMPCQGKAALVCCHYTHPTNYALNPQANPCQLNSQEQIDRVIAVQIHHFTKFRQILTDQQALGMLNGMGQSPTQQQNPGDNNNNNNGDSNNAETTKVY